MSSSTTMSSDEESKQERKSVGRRGDNVDQAAAETIGRQLRSERKARLVEIDSQAAEAAAFDGDDEDDGDGGDDEPPGDIPDAGDGKRRIADVPICLFGNCDKPGNRRTGLCSDKDHRGEKKCCICNRVNASMISMIRKKKACDRCYDGKCRSQNCRRRAAGARHLCGQHRRLEDCEFCGVAKSCVEARPGFGGIVACNMCCRKKAAVFRGLYPGESIPQWLTDLETTNAAQNSESRAADRERKARRNGVYETDDDKSSDSSSSSDDSSSDSDSSSSDESKNGSGNDESSDDESSGDDNPPGAGAATRRSKRKRSQPSSYRENSSDSDDDEPPAKRHRRR